MRLIDADAYAAEMKKRQGACMEAMENDSYEGEQFSPREHWDGVFAAFAEAKLTLDDMPTVGGWVSVKDGLPEAGMTCLLYADGCIIVGRYIEYDQWLTPGVGKAPTHWMPLPEPPEGVSEDG